MRVAIKTLLVSAVMASSAMAEEISVCYTEPTPPPHAEKPEPLRHVFDPAHEGEKASGKAGTVKDLALPKDAPPPPPMGDMPPPPHHMMPPSRVTPDSRLTCYFSGASEPESRTLAELANDGWELEAISGLNHAFFFQRDKPSAEAEVKELEKATPHAGPASRVVIPSLNLAH